VDPEWLDRVAPSKGSIRPIPGRSLRPGGARVLLRPPRRAWLGAWSTQSSSVLALWSAVDERHLCAADLRDGARSGARGRERPAVRRAGHRDRDRLGDAGRECRIPDRRWPGPAAYAALVTGRLGDWTQRIERRGFLAVLYARIAPGAPRPGQLCREYDCGSSPPQHDRRISASVCPRGVRRQHRQLPAPAGPGGLGVLVAMSLGGALLPCGHAEDGRRVSVGGRGSESFGHPRGSYEGWLRPIKR